METKFTKGPWKVESKSKSGKHNINIIGTNLGGKYKIATVPFSIENDENDKYLAELNLKWELEAMADASLIAAAPDLFEALQLATELLKYYAPIRK